MKTNFLFILFFTIIFCFCGCEKEPEAPVLVPPEANFSASATSIYKSQAVDFLDLSTINPTTWAWTFSGGSPTNSNQKNPTGIVYSTPGVYDVSLTVSNSDGSDTKTLTGHITVNDADVQLLLDNNVGIDDILTSYPMDSLYGKKYLGGLIFYYYSNQFSSGGYVAAEIDQSTGTSWGCNGSDLSGFNCSGNSIGGYSIGGTIGCLASYTAWGICDYLIYNNYTDWALPGATGLVYMYQNLHLKGYGNFANASYWSYCESSSTAAKTVSFANGVIYDFSSKTSSHRVRAIRGF